MQLVPQQFHDRSQGGIIPVTALIKMSMDKAIDTDISFAQYDISMYNGGDLYGTNEDNPIQQWDYYDYKDYTGRIIDVEWSREIEFPYSVSSAMADFTLNNFDDYFSPDSGSPIDQYILPKRPFRIFAGYNGVGDLQQVVGITEKAPVRNEDSKTVEFHGTDFLVEMFDLDLTKVISMQNARTDQVLAEIFNQFGLNPASYTLAKGRNVIPFLFIDRGLKAGTVIRNLMQAEGGHLWIDEQGLLRMEPRLAPVNTPVMLFDASNIIEISDTGEDEVINDVRIKSNVRKVMAFQRVYGDVRDDDTDLDTEKGFIIPANSSRPFNANLDDPLLTVSQPTSGVKNDDSWFTAVNFADQSVGSVSVTGGSLSNNQYTVFFQNNNNFAVIIDQVEIWGEPARIANPINYKTYDQDSIDKYERRLLEIDNDFFGSESNCDSFAELIIDSYKEHAPVIQMRIKGNFALQLNDIINVNYEMYNDNYRIIGIYNNPITHEYRIKAARYNPREWAQYDVSKYDEAIYAP